MMIDKEGVTMMTGEVEVVMAGTEKMGMVMTEEGVMDVTEVMVTETVMVRAFALVSSLKKHLYGFK